MPSIVRKEQIQVLGASLLLSLAAYNYQDGEPTASSCSISHAAAHAASSVQDKFALTNG